MPKASGDRSSRTFGNNMIAPLKRRCTTLCAHILLLMAFHSGLSFAFEGESFSELDAIAIAEQFVRDPAFNISPGKVQREAWGYKSVDAGKKSEKWIVLFQVDIDPIPVAKGNESAWGILVQVDRSTRQASLMHGAMAAYNGEPFYGYTRIKKSR